MLVSAGHGVIGAQPAFMQTRMAIFYQSAGVGRAAVQLMLLHLSFVWLAALLGAQCASVVCLLLLQSFL